MGDILRHNNGWIKLSRDILESEIFTDDRLYKIWSYLLLIAAWRGGSKIIFNGQQRDIKVGDCVTGVRDIAKALGYPRTTVMRRLQYLEKTGRIRTESGTRGMIINIINFHIYQGEDEEVGHKRDESGTRVGHERTLIKKERKKEDNTPTVTEFCQLWNRLSGELPKVKIPVSESRSRKIKTRLKEMSDLNTWSDIISWLSEQEWANGTPPRNWTATIDYILRPGKWEELSEKLPPKPVVDPNIEKLKEQPNDIIL